MYNFVAYKDRLDSLVLVQLITRKQLYIVIN